MTENKLYNELKAFLEREYSKWQYDEKNGCYFDEPYGEICTVDSTCNLEKALKWYEEDIDGFVYIQLVDHNSMLIEVLKCNF